MPWKNKVAQKAYAKAYHQKRKDEADYRTYRKSNNKKWRENNRIVLNEYARKQHCKPENKVKREKYLKENRLKLNATRRLHNENLTEWYMVKHLKKLGYSEADIKKYPELIKAHRIIIKTKRLWKKSRTSPN